MLSPTKDRVRFGPFELDLNAWQLRKNGTRIKIPQQPLQLLAMLLERPGVTVSREELRQRLWPSEVFVDFDHGLNKNIQKLREALGDSAGLPRYVETIPRTGYRFIGPGIEQQQSQEGEGDVKACVTGTSGAGSTTRHPKWGRTLHWVVLFGCAAAIVSLTVWLAQRPSQATPIRSVAVLPFKNLSNDPNQEYFAEGMTDELITMLAKNSTLRVVSQTSAMQFKGAHGPVRDIARELGVDGIVEGSVDRSGKKLHMTVQLIHAPSDTSVWAESYDQDANDPGSLPREVAQTIAKQLHRAVLQPPPQRLVRPEAHDAYLHGRYLWFLIRNDESGPYFKKAVELQPDYALGWSGLAFYYGGGAIEGTLNPKGSLAQAEAAATKSVELDESLPEAHLALAGAVFINHWDWARADREIARAIALDPQFAEAYHLRAIVFAALNRHDEAIEAQKKATALDPFSRPWAMALSWLLARQYDTAMKETLARQQAEGNPQDAKLHWTIANIYRRQGMEKEAGPALEQGLLLEADKASAASIRRAFHQGGYKGLVGWQLNEANKKSLTRYVSPFYRATLTAELGRREETLALLEEGYRQHSPPMLWVQNDPAFDFLHSDERYRAIIRGIGLPPAY